MDQIYHVISEQYILSYNNFSGKLNKKLFLDKITRQVCFWLIQQIEYLANQGTLPQ